MAYVLAWAVVFAAWRAWWGTMASHEVFRIGGGLAQIGGEIVTAAALGDPRVIPPGRADDAPADDGELDCRGQTEPLRLRRSFAVVFGRDPDPGGRSTVHYALPGGRIRLRNYGIAAGVMKIPADGVGASLINRPLGACARIFWGQGPPCRQRVQNALRRLGRGQIGRPSYFLLEL